MIYRHLVAGTWGNISGKIVEGNCWVIVITPSGMDYRHLKPEDLPVVNAAGKVIEGKRRPSTEVMLHLLLYQARPDIAAVVHTHSRFASVLGVLRQSLPPLLEELAQIVGGEVRVAEYARAGTRELAASVVKAIGESAAVLLPHHGMVGVGRNVREALTICEIVEKGAEVYCWASLLGKPGVLEASEVAVLREDYLLRYGQRGEG